MSMTSDILVEDLNQQVTLRLIKYFIADMQELIEDAESHTQNIAKVVPQLKLLKKDENKSFTETLEQIALWHEKTIGEPSSYQRGVALFAKGKLYLACQFLEKIKKKYHRVFTESNFEAPELLDLLEELNKFSSEYEKNVFYFEKSLDNLFAELTGPLAEQIEKQASLADLRLKQGSELDEGLTKVIVERFLVFIENLKIKVINAIAFCIDMSGRTQGYVPQVAFRDKDAILKFYSENQALHAAVLRFSSMTDIVPLFTKLQATFSAYVQAAVNVDIGLPLGVKRISYITQALDKALFFNPGFCMGGGRALAEKRMEAGFQYSESQDNRKAVFTRYQDLHDFSVSARMYHLHTNQGNLTKLNDSGNHIYIKMAECTSTNNFKNGDGSVNVDALQVFIQSLVGAVAKSAAAYLALQDYAPLIQIALSNTLPNDSSHAIEFEVFKVNEKTLYVLHDTNVGKFESGSLEGMIKLLCSLFLSNGDVYLNYNIYQVCVLEPKQRNYSNSIMYLYQAYENGGLATKLKVQMNAAHTEFQDNVMRLRVAKAWRSQKVSEPISTCQEMLDAYHQIKQPRGCDHQWAAFTYVMLCGEYEDIAPVLSFEYCNKAVELIKMYKTKKTATEWQGLEALCYISIGLSGKNINDNHTMQIKDFEHLHKGVKLAQEIITNTKDLSESEEMQAFKKQLDEAHEWLDNANEINNATI